MRSMQWQLGMLGTIRAFQVATTCFSRSPPDLYTLYGLNPSVTTKLLYSFQNISTFDDMFQPTWLPPGHSQYVQNTWEEIKNETFSEVKLYMNFFKVNDNNTQYVMLFR